MIKWVALFFICFFTSISPQTIISPQFSELKGMEDQLGNTILFYRIFQDSSWNEIYFFRTNHIYRFNVETGANNFFLYDYNFETEGGMEHFNIYDIDFWDSDPDKFIYCGHAGIFDSHTFVFRFDEPTINFFPGWIGSVNKIELSTNNDSLITLGCWANFAGIYIRTSKSTDGGYTWDTISDSLEFLALKPDNDQVLFCFNDNGYISNYNGCLYKSTNGGVNFYLVDTLKKYPSAENDEILYDANTNNILRLFETMYDDFVLRISLNNGEAFSWQTKYSSDSKIYISNDESTSGTIYLADKKNIFISTDYGNNFTPFKTLDRKIVGIYKKPNSNTLYAATKYKIYEITPDTNQVIKSLPIPEEVLNLYPLSIGNKWVYDVWGWWADTTYHSYSGVTYREDVGDTVMSNSQFYYKLYDPTTFNYPPYLFERIDTSSGKVFRYDETLGLPNNEYLIDDLFAEVGDTIWSSRHQYQDYFPFICVGEGIFNKWGIQGQRKIFTIFDLTGYTYSLSQGVGIDSIYDTFDFGENFVTLKGCIIDGIVYGDTTVVSVEDEKLSFISNFRLEQNYPNPFNPSTKIKFEIPGQARNDIVLVTLKVYDVLGNEIATLVNEEKPAGEYEIEFNGHSDEGQNLSSGVYFYQLRVGGPETGSGQAMIQTKKMVYLK